MAGCWVRTNLLGCAEPVCRGQVAQQQLLFFVGGVQLGYDPLDVKGAVEEVVALVVLGLEGSEVGLVVPVSQALLVD